MSEIQSVIEKAFDYRGDVTLHLKSGSPLVGYVFNREDHGTKRCSEPFLEVMVAGSDEKKLVRYSEISRVEFTGEDTAAGKSWEDWTAKEEARKKAALAGNGSHP